MIPSRECSDWLFETAACLIDDRITMRVDEGALIVLPTEDDFPSTPR